MHIIDLLGVLSIANFEKVYILSRRQIMAKSRTGRKAGGHKEKRSEGGLSVGFIIIPAEIEAIPESVLSSKGKRWYGHVFGFGAGGCWQSETKHARRYEVTDRTVRRWSRVLEGLGEICRLNIKGKWGCVWALRNPEVMKEEFLVHDEVGVRNPAYRKQATGKEPRTYKSAHPGHGSPHTPDMGMQEHRTYMSGNYYNINKSTSAASPLPADGQAQRLTKEEEEHLNRLGAIRAEIARQLPLKQAIGIEEIGKRVVLMVKLTERAEPKVKGGLCIETAVREAIEEETGLSAQEVKK